MTLEHLLHALETDTALQDEIIGFEHGRLALLNSYSEESAYLLGITQLSAEAREYLLHYYNQVDGHYNRVLDSYPAHQYISKLPKSIVIPDGKHLVELIGLDTYRKLAKPNIYNRERNRRNEVAFDDNAKDLKLDMFSLKVFENHLLNSKKLSGKDATRYINKLPTSYNNTDEERVMIARYQKLIWDNVKVKSLELSKKILNTSLNTVPDFEKAFAINPRPSKAETTWASDVAFGLYFFQMESRQYNIPMLVDSYQVTESYVHQYITGVPKKNPMERMDILYAIDKIKLLTHMISIDRYNCPYYQQTIDQLESELRRPENAKQLRAIGIEQESTVAALVKTENLIASIVDDYVPELSTDDCLNEAS